MHVRGRDRPDISIHRFQYTLGLRIGMPQIGKIGEAKVYIYFEDHNPPHVHVRLGENDAEVGIESPVILAGRLPPGALRGIANWLNHNKQEIIDRWRAARAGVPFNPLEGDWK